MILLLILFIVGYIVCGFLTFMLYCYYDKKYNLYIEDNEESLFLIVCCLVWPLMIIAIIHYFFGKDIGKTIYKWINKEKK